MSASAASFYVPEVAVTSIDFVSTKEIAAPFLISITVEP